MSIFTNSNYKKTLTYANSFYNKNEFVNGIEIDENNKTYQRQKKDYSIDNENENNNKYIN